MLEDITCKILIEPYPLYGIHNTITCLCFDESKLSSDINNSHSAIIGTLFYSLLLLKTQVGANKTFSKKKILCDIYNRPVK